jgi:hypothetical protein
MELSSVRSVLTQMLHLLVMYGNQSAAHPVAETDSTLAEYPHCQPAEVCLLILGVGREGNNPLL